MRWIPRPPASMSPERKKVGDVRIERLGGVLRQQILDRPAFGQLPRVPDQQAVGVDPDLDGSRDGVVAVDDGVQQHLTERALWHWIALDALEAFVADPSLEVLRQQQIEGLAGLREPVARDLIVIAKVRLAREVADLDRSTRDESLGVRVEEERSSALEVPAIGQAELLDQARVVLGQDILTEAVAAPG